MSENKRWEQNDRSQSIIFLYSIVISTILVSWTLLCQVLLYVGFVESVFHVFSGYRKLHVLGLATRLSIWI